MKILHIFASALLAILSLSLLSSCNTDSDEKNHSIVDLATYNLYTDSSNGDVIGIKPAGSLGVNRNFFCK